MHQQRFTYTYISSLISSFILHVRYIKQAVGLPLSPLTRAPLMGLTYEQSLILVEGSFLKAVHIILWFSGALLWESSIDCNAAHSGRNPEEQHRDLGSQKMLSTMVTCNFTNLGKHNMQLCQPLKAFSSMRHSEDLGKQDEA